MACRLTTLKYRRKCRAPVKIFFRGTFTVTTHTSTADPLLDLPVEDIAHVEVLRGAAATARYGMQGSNGVILISTRRGADGSTTPQTLRVHYAG